MPGATRAPSRSDGRLLVGKGRQHLVVAVGETNPRKAFFQIATFEKGSHATRDHRSPEAVLGLKALVVDLPKGVKMLVQQPLQIGSTRITWPIQGQQFGAGKRHELLIGPKTAVAHNRLRSVLQKLGNQQQADVHFEQAKQIKQNRP